MSLFLLLPGKEHGRRVCAHIDELYGSQEELDKMKRVYVESYLQQTGIVATPVYIPEAMNEMLSKMLFGSFIIAMDINAARQTALPGTVALENEEIPEAIIQLLYTLYCSRLDVSRFVQTQNEPEFSLIAQMLVKQYTNTINSVLKSVAKQSLTLQMSEINITEQQHIAIGTLEADHVVFNQQHDLVHARALMAHEEAMAKGTELTNTEEDTK